MLWFFFSALPSAMTCVEKPVVLVPVPGRGLAHG